VQADKMYNAIENALDDLAIGEEHIEQELEDDLKLMDLHNWSVTYISNIAEDIYNMSQLETIEIVIKAIFYHITTNETLTTVSIVSKSECISNFPKIMCDLL
jgi:hypothetical protein